jgi:hypothetical protein
MISDMRDTFVLSSSGLSDGNNMEKSQFPKNLTMTGLGIFGLRLARNWKK